MATTTTRPPSTYSLADLDWIALGSSGWTRAAITLDRGESIVNPASTKRLIYGPAVVKFDRGPDGGIDVYVEDLS